MVNNQKENGALSIFKNKLKNEYPNIFLTHLSEKKLNTKDLKISKQNKSEYMEPIGLYYSRNYKRLNEGLKLNRKNKIKFGYRYKYLYGLKFKEKKIYTSLDKPNPTLILVLKTEKDCINFKNKYCLKKEVIATEMSPIMSLDKLKEQKFYKEMKNEKTRKQMINYYTKKRTNVIVEFPEISYYKVSKDFGGLDFQCHCHFGYFSSKNYGVIWNTDIISDLELMYKM